jgi:hypothetical protein
VRSDVQRTPAPRGDPRSRLILREKRTAEEGPRSYAITSSHTGGKAFGNELRNCGCTETYRPSASIVFAAWIFMGFLQQRYDAAVERYRSMIGECRTQSGVSDARRRNIREQLATYQRRCRLMNAACNVGLLSAILLILSLIAGELDVIFTGITLFKDASALASLAGFMFVIAAAVLVLIESAISRRQLDWEVMDIPGLANTVDRGRSRLDRERGLKSM